MRLLARVTGSALPMMAAAHYSSSVRFASTTGSEQSTMRVAVIQMLVETDKAQNLAHCREMVEKAAATGAELVVLPEVWNSEYAVAAFRGNAESVEEGESTKMLRELAAEKNVWIVGGSIPELGADDKIYNSSPIIDDSGEIKGIARKVHLFDIDVPGKIRFFESETLSAGSEATVVDFKNEEKLGVAICYDSRFAPLAIAMRGKGATILAYPGAFNTVTGPPHYHLLARARALDSQAFVIFASPARNPNASYQAYGHSIICDPWGTPVAQAEGHDEEIIVADLDLSRVREVRDSMRLWDQLRNDAYGNAFSPDKSS